MCNNTTQTAPASAGVKLPAENQHPQAQLPPEHQRCYESASELKAFLNEKELLALVPISRRTAFTWIQNGKLPCVKIGRRKLFHWPSVEAALLRQQVNGE